LEAGVVDTTCPLGVNDIPLGCPTIRKILANPALGPAARFAWLDQNSLPEYVPLLQLAAGPDRPQLAAAHHSENWYELSGLQDGPVKGMSF
jgi:hypothetical protein